VNTQRSSATTRESGSAGLDATALLTGANRISTFRGGGSRAAVLAMQRSVGNSAVSRLMASSSQASVAVQRAPTQEPPKLPIAGDANFMLLDKERHFPIDLPDLDDFGIGAGELSTGNIGVAEGVDARLDVGANNPPRIADASVHISPVQANIAASAIAERRKTKEGAGVVEAGIGGVVGGLVGLAAGPVGWATGLNPISGAEKGGL
jgi:hypothetical protein